MIKRIVSMLFKYPFWAPPRHALGTRLLAGEAAVLEFLRLAVRHHNRAQLERTALLVLLVVDENLASRGSEDRAFTGRRQNFLHCLALRVAFATVRLIHDFPPAHTERVPPAGGR
jgi:hypothetical protein